MTQVVETEAVAHRFVQAHIHLMSQIGARVTFAALAERVSRAHGRRRFTAGQISEYQKGNVAQALDVVWAYAKATGVDPGWLAFGTSSSAHAPVTTTQVPEVVKGVTKPKRKRA